VDPRQIRESVSARPDSETLQESYAQAAYEAALEAQRAGAPSSERARILVAYAEEWAKVQAELDAITDG